MKKGRKQILQVLAGSRGYGVFDDSADYDYRSVYVEPTSNILSLDYTHKGTHWVEDKAGGKDETGYEIGHFLQLATHCNPTILNTLKAPVVEINQDGEELRKLFPYFLNAKQCYDAYKGYGLNQRKKMLDNKDKRWRKYGMAYVRQLWYLYNLILKGDYEFSILGTESESMVRAIQAGDWSPGRIIDHCDALIAKIDTHIKIAGWPLLCQDTDKINKFLLFVRSKYW